jgi:hypothetical protein
LHPRGASGSRIRGSLKIQCLRGLASGSANRIPCAAAGWGAYGISAAPSPSRSLQTFHLPLLANLPFWRPLLPTCPPFVWCQEMCQNTKLARPPARLPARLPARSLYEKIPCYIRTSTRVCPPTRMLRKTSHTTSLPARKRYSRSPAPGPRERKRAAVCRRDLARCNI